MELALTVFLVTLAVVGGILSPLILIMVITTFSNSMKALAARLELAVKNADRLPPFDDVEANLNPMTKVLSIRIVKAGKVLWQGSATRNDQEAYPTVNFSKDAEQ